MVLDAARALGVDIDSVCGGRGICGRCQITVGSNPKINADDSRLSTRTRTELEYKGRRPLGDHRRLSCAATVVRDVVVDVPPESQVHRQVIRKRAEVIDIPVDPVVRLYYVEVAEPDMHEPLGDLERMVQALEEQWEVSGLEFDHHLLSRLQPALKQGARAITVAVHDDRRIIALWPGFHDTAFGVAFDIGSTTVAGHLCDLSTGAVLASAGRMNPQIRFGEDLMSRVSYVMMNQGGDTEMTTAVRQALDGLIGELAAEASVDREDILEITLVGNPIMHHLALGIDPTPLGTAPFALATDHPVLLPASELELDANPGARVYVLPCIAGHVGADTAGAILSEGPHRRQPIQLLVDVGTNAEIVLGNQDRLLAASSPTGPAFEGAQITSGQRAAPGAIERVRIDGETYEPRFKVIGQEMWSDEPGFDHSAVTGICGSGIIEVVAEMFLAGLISADGVIVARDTGRLLEEGRTRSYVLMAGESPIVITQNDVRAIQLAKAALYAGVRLLMDHLETDSVDEIRLAGAFGSHIDTTYAMVLGLIPDCDLDRVSAAGNAAGTGAVMALLSAEARREIETVVRKVEKIETAVEPAFQRHFVEAMGIPHSSAAFPNLATVVTFPTARPAAADRPRRRRRREESA